jgi:hypothetical protein
MTFIRLRLTEARKSSIDEKLIPGGFLFVRKDSREPGQGVVRATEEDEVLGLNLAARNLC